MNYYISGQSGFLGTAITKYLEGKSVFSIPRHQSIEQLKQLFYLNNPDVIIHLAAYGNQYYQRDFIGVVNANIIGTYNLLEAAKEFNYKTFYNLSTSSVTFFDKPTYYSITKLCGEQLAGMYKNVINVRPYSIYGPGEQKHRFIPTIIDCLNTGAEMILDERACHDWVYIDCAVEALFAGATRIGAGIKISNLEVVRMLEQISGKKLKYTSGTLRIYDNEDWVCKEGVKDIGMYEGLKRTYESMSRY
ncbi:MAG TPA: NAD(P)-dependent oxidoreductase [Patescibacteria group bacterium]|nr:NAD(P)-dependent oxidoreductase [Patescibacteria group bacterium]